MSVDLRPLPAAGVEDVVALWNRSMPRDPITLSRFRNLFLLDPNFDPDGLTLAFDDDRLAGAIYAARRLVPLHGADLEPDQGWIGFFFVHPDHRRRGIGDQLLRAALSWLERNGRRTVSFSPTTPNYFLPGLDAQFYPAAAAFLQKHGFRPSAEAVAMDFPLSDYEIPAPARALVASLEANGYHFGCPSVDDLIDLVPLARDRFNPDWGRAIREAITAGMPLERIVIARRPDGTLAGWAMFGTYEAVIERFGPFGVRAECRGTGLGKALLHLTLDRMRAHGAHSAWFLWTGEESAAGFLYRKAGFQITRRFSIMTRS